MYSMPNKINMTKVQLTFSLFHNLPDYSSISKAVDLLDIKPGFDPQASHQKKIQKKNTSSALSAQKISDKNKF